MFLGKRGENEVWTPQATRARPPLHFPSARAKGALTRPCDGPSKREPGVFGERTNALPARSTPSSTIVLLAAAGLACAIVFCETVSGESGPHTGSPPLAAVSARISSTETLLLATALAGPLGPAPKQTAGWLGGPSDGWSCGPGALVRASPPPRGSVLRAHCALGSRP